MYTQSQYGKFVVKTIAYNQNFVVHRYGQDLFEIAMLLLDLQVIEWIVLHSECMQKGMNSV